MQQPEDIDARRKKTDEPTPDDEEEEEEEEKEKDEKKKADVGAGGDGAGDKPSQADLETTEVCQNEPTQKKPTTGNSHGWNIACRLRVTVISID